MDTELLKIVNQDPEEFCKTVSIKKIKKRLEQLTSAKDGMHKIVRIAKAKGINKSEMLFYQVVENLTEHWVDTLTRELEKRKKY